MGTRDASESRRFDQAVVDIERHAGSLRLGWRSRAHASPVSFDTARELAGSSTVDCICALEVHSCWLPKGDGMDDKLELLHGSLVLMVLRTLDTLGPLHGWGIARRIEQASGDLLALKQ